MNRRWMITIGLIVVALIVIGVMHERGMLNFKWQVLTMIFAALAGPYTLLKRFLIKDPRMREIENEQKINWKEEKEHRANIDAELAEKDAQIQKIRNELELAEKRLELIEAKKENIKKDIDKMSLEEKQNQAINYFGD